MVYITSEDGTEKKFACIKCIKGHRSSKCNHANRELFEIKKKGRPVSQCDTCRQLRKTKQIHIKCMCHLDVKLKDALNNNSSSGGSSNNASPVVDEDFRPSGLYLSYPANASPSSSTALSGSCAQCNRSVCICPMNQAYNTGNSLHSMNIANIAPLQEVYMSPSSSDGSITPPVYEMNYPERFNTSSSAGLNNNCSVNNTPSPTSGNTTPNIHTTPKPLHLTIPIHDPSDDIDSDTPIYKTQEESQPFVTNTNPDELMDQIYSGFNGFNNDKTPSSSTSSPHLREDDHQLAELAKDD